MKWTTLVMLYVYFTTVVYKYLIVPVGGVGLQVLDYVFGYGPSKDGLSFSQINQVRRDL